MASARIFERSVALSLFEIECWCLLQWSLQSTKHMRDSVFWQGRSRFKSPGR